MEWFLKLLQSPESVAHLIILYALVISLGVKLGRWKIGGRNGVAFGVTWVLFVGILVGHVCTQWLYEDPAAAVEHQEHIIHVVKELGLILFVYCIGLQVGPSFFQTFKSGGWGMNFIAVSIVLLNVAVMLGLYYLGEAIGVFSEPGSRDNLPMMVGVMYGAVTNTPGLGAASGLLKDLLESDAPSIANGYACSYPLGVMGIILSTLAIKYIAGISLKKEHQALAHHSQQPPASPPRHLVVRVVNPAAVGRTIAQLIEQLGREFVVTRYLLPDSCEVCVPTLDTVLQEGMTLHVVCAEETTTPLLALLGELTEGVWFDDLKDANYTSVRMPITRYDLHDKPLSYLQAAKKFGVNITRVTRNDEDSFATTNFQLQMGDRLLVTGRKEAVEHFRKSIGGDAKHLHHPNVGAIFFGILIGVIVGQIPIPIPGVALPVKLGLAGGPLVVSIIIGAFGYRYNINTYTSISANFMLREVGLILFLSSVGLQAGATFWQTLTQGDGIHYVWMGVLITTIPILICGLYARWRMKLNYFTLMGLIAGANTDPPALAFANSTAGNHVPAIGYSTVYPLTMFLRILVAQLVLLFFLA